MKRERGADTPFHTVFILKKLDVLFDILKF